MMFNSRDSKLVVGLLCCKGGGEKEKQLGWARFVLVYIRQNVSSGESRSHSSTLIHVTTAERSDL